MKPLSVVVERAKDGEPLVCIEENEKKIYLSSRFSPKAEASRLLDPYKKKPQDFIILLGSGNLSLLFYLCENLSFNYLAVVEKSKEIALTIKNYLREHMENAYLEKIIFYTEEEYKELELWFKKKEANDVQIFINRTQANLFDEFYQKAYDNIISYYNQKSINIATMNRFEHLWLRNVMKNTFHIIENPGLNSLKNHFRGEKALIVAAGPSLKKHLSFLKKAQYEIVIIAVDTILKVLLHHGIKPHFVVVVDPQKINAQYVENVDKTASDEIVYIFEPSVCESALRDKKHLLVFDTIFPYYHLLTKHFGKKGEIDLGGNVSTSAYEIAAYLGFDEVGFVGLDMSFPKDSYHVEGTLYENQWFSLGTRLKPFESMMHKLMDYSHLQKIKGYQDEEIFLDVKFRMFTKWFDKKQLVEKHTQFYNCSEAGYLFENMENINLENFVGSEKRNLNVFEESLKKIRKTKPPLESFIEELAILKENIRQYLEHAIEGIGLCQKLLEGTSGKQAFLIKLENLDKLLLANFPGKDLVNISVQKAVQTITGKKNLNPSLEESLSDSKYLYEEIKTSCELNIKYMKQVIERYEFCKFK